jgi:hypothetical protein
LRGRFADCIGRGCLSLSSPFSFREAQIFEGLPPGWVTLRQPSLHGQGSPSESLPEVSVSGWQESTVPVIPDEMPNREVIESVILSHDPATQLTIRARLKAHSHGPLGGDGGESQSKARLDRRREDYGEELRDLTYEKRSGVHRILFTIHGDVIRIIELHHSAQGSIEF